MGQGKPTVPTMALNSMEDQIRELTVQMATMQDMLLKRVSSNHGSSKGRPNQGSSKDSPDHGSSSSSSATSSRRGRHGGGGGGSPELHLTMMMVQNPQIQMKILTVGRKD